MKGLARRRGPVLLAWLVLLLAPALAGAAPTTAREVLADPAYGFCHDERYPLTEDEAKWCPLLPAVDPPCPAFAAACGAPRAIFDGPAGPMSERAPGEAKEAEPGSRTRREPDRRPPPEAEVEAAPVDAGPLPHVLVWIIVAVMVIAVLMQLRGAGGPAPRRTAEPAPDAPKEAEAEPEALDPRETDADRLLARATRRAERGDLAGAVTDGHAALLRRLAERGHVRLLPSRTNGDHVRDLRGEPALHEPTRQVVRIVERVQFGHAAVAKGDVERLLAQVRSVLGTLTGAFLVVWTSLACTGDGAKEYPWSHSPSGRAGVIELLRRNGLEATYRTAPLEGLDRRSPTLVVLEGAKLSSAELDALAKHWKAGGRMILAGRDVVPWALQVRPSVRRPGPLHRSVLADPTELPPVLVPGDAGVQSSETYDSSRVLLGDDEGGFYALERGFAIVLADDHLFTNAALAVPDNGAFLVELMLDVGGPFELVDGQLRDLVGDGGADDPFDAMERAELTPVIAQLLALVLLLYFWRGAHFGRPRDPPPPSRRRFAEHVEALAQQYQRAGARRHALHLYAGWALERVQERFGGQRRGLHHLAGRIAARTGQDETEIMRTLVEAHHARDDVHDGHGAPEDLQVLRDLGRLIDTPTGSKRGAP